MRIKNKKNLVIVKLSFVDRCTLGFSAFLNLVLLFFATFFSFFEIIKHLKRFNNLRRKKRNKNKQIIIRSYTYYRAFVLRIGVFMVLLKLPLGVVTPWPGEPMVCTVVR